MREALGNGDHGGALRRAALAHGIPMSEWLDLSTGIAPWAWPVPLLPAECWQRLPEDGPEGDGLESIAAAHYGAPHILSVAGSQAAILALPRLRAASRVAVARGSYAEHALAWFDAGHDVETFPLAALPSAANHADVVVVANPDNPTGRKTDIATLLDMHGRLQRRGGWLVVDEAFLDAEDEPSLAAHSDAEGLIVLRSLGKFFGLAGARIGFVCAQRALLRNLSAALGAWTVNTPARFVARHALSDASWQRVQKLRLARASTHLATLLARSGLTPTGGCRLFQWVATPRAADLAGGLARHGVLVRHLPAPQALRFGLPASHADWQRLQGILSNVMKETP
ncbi:threonine-phosphate decarboxylase CobD [Uliginosibacterium sp. sgz301328]|uniref:threonine-phosphate decarboxylase CobD n=1 Tax=Uliginosibacterium sp. sgz301328 TaxID=3243764 RepID=UPI00359E8B83